MGVICVGTGVSDGGIRVGNGVSDGGMLVLVGADVSVGCEVSVGASVGGRRLVGLGDRNRVGRMMTPVGDGNSVVVGIRVVVTISLVVIEGSTVISPPIGV
jgi:hypothetical protein